MKEMMAEMGLFGKGRLWRALLCCICTIAMRRQVTSKAKGEEFVQYY